MLATKVTIRATVMAPVMAPVRCHELVQASKLESWRAGERAAGTAPDRRHNALLQSGR